MTRSDRVIWLRAHPEVLKLKRREIAALLKREGLLSPKTALVDVNIFNLMRDAGYSRRDCDRFSAMKDAPLVAKGFSKHDY